MAGLAEYPDLSAASGPSAAAKAPKTGHKHTKFFDLALHRGLDFFRLAQAAYTRAGGRAHNSVAAARTTASSTTSQGAEKHPSVGTQEFGPGLLASAFREYLQASLRIPAIEGLFDGSWAVAARRVLPNPDPQRPSTAIWGPLLAWCVLQMLASSIDPDVPESTALDLFDRLRLREPLAQAFAALGLEGEESWRAAARIKILLLTEANVGQTQAEETTTKVPRPTASTSPSAVAEALVAASKASEPAPGQPQAEGDKPKAKGSEPASEGEKKSALPPALWLDPDVRWLTGVHKAEDHAYLVHELYEELLWWLPLPSLLKLAAEKAPNTKTVAALTQTVEEALAAANAAGYRVDVLLGSHLAGEETEAVDAGETTAPEIIAQAIEPEPVVHTKAGAKTDTEPQA